MVGVGELFIIIALLTFGGVGVDQKAKPPAPDEVSRWAPDGADYAGYWHTRAVLPGAFAEFRKLPEHPALSRFVQVKRDLSRAVAELDEALAEGERQFGINPIQDIHWMAGWLQVVDDGDPRLLIAVGGSFPADLATILKHTVGGEETTIGGHPALKMSGREQFALAFVDKNTVVFGTEAWVRAGVVGQTCGKSAFAGELKRALKRRPYFLLASSPSPVLRQTLASKMTDGAELFLKDLLTTHTFFSIALEPRGVSWHWRADTDRSARLATMASEGIVELLRAGHYGTRGLARLLLAGLHSYDDLDERWARVLKHEKPILELVWKFTGDGKFTATVDRKGLDVTARARGKKLTDVLPTAAVLAIGGGAAAYWLFRSVDKPAAAPVEDAGRGEPEPAERRGTSRGTEKEGVRPRPQPVHPIPTP